MITLEYPQTEQENLGLALWLKERVPDVGVSGGFRCVAFFEKGVGIQAVVMYTNYRQSSLEMVFAAEPGGRWAQRDLMDIVMSWPFAIGCNRITALCRKSNKLSRKLVQQLGFKQEGKLRRGATDGEDVFIYGLLEGEYRLTPRQKLRRAA